jgi:tRNA threonylcarbamoyladenosine biosynthesis protein TsaE
MEFQVNKSRLPQFAQQFWKEVKEARVFAFHGSMGAGKTTLITALCKAKGVTDTIGSPTFSIINQYVFEENGTEQTIYHMDLYRLKDEQDLATTGVEECIYSGSICMVEWPDKAPELFDRNTVHIYIEARSHDQRNILIKLPNEP